MPDKYSAVRVSHSLVNFIKMMIQSKYMFNNKEKNYSGPIQFLSIIVVFLVCIT